MRYSLPDAVRGYTIRYRIRKFFRRFARMLACIVAFVTTYALILPAITMEKPSFCGFEEHTHGESCVAQSYQQTELICSPADDLHVHSEACFDGSGRNLCGQADYLVHSHSEICWDAQFLHQVCITGSMADAAYLCHNSLTG